MSTTTDRLFAALDATVGATERPKGSNTDHGGHIDRCQWRYGMGRGTRTGAVPWCNCHAGERVAAAGINDHGVMSPATAVTADRARAAGFTITHPIPGAHMVWYGKHIGTVRRVYTRTLTLNNEGNSDDAVRHVTRSTAGTILFALPAIKAAGMAPPPEPVTLYGFEDPRGRVLHPGSWRTKTFAKNAVRRMGPLGRGATLTKRGGKWRVLMPARFRGYATRKGRDAWQVKRQAEINAGRPAGLPPVTLRSYRYEVTVITNPQAQAQNLGRTI